MRAGRICDGCHSATSPSRIFPAGWLHIRINGRPTGEANSTLLGSGDVCSSKCAASFLEKNYFPTVAPPPGVPSGLPDEP